MGPPIVAPLEDVNEYRRPLRARPIYHREVIWSLLVQKLIKHGLEPAVVANLEASGWALIDTISGASRDELGKTILEAAGALGRPVPSLPGRPLVEWLSTVPERTRRPNLTALHGSGAFPLHTDTAHWPVPARYLFLSCFEPGEAGRATLVWRFDETVFTGSQLDTLRGEPVLFVTGRNSFYSTVLSPSRPFVRIDLGCMRAITSAGRNVLGMLKEVLESVTPARIRWRRGGLLLLDNWQVLHGRDSTEVPDAARTLGRTLIRNEDT